MTKKLANFAKGQDTQTYVERDVGNKPINKRGHVLITGGSSGIGCELAKVFADNGFDLVISGRSRERLWEVASQIELVCGSKPHIIVADLSLPDGVATILTSLEKIGVKPAFVVNNAAIGIFGPLALAKTSDQLSMVDINCRALAALTIGLLPDVLRHRGGVLNVCSVGGFLPGPGMAVYFASKAFVISFTAALREEVRQTGVRVSALCPGPSPTRFQRRAGMISERMPRLITENPKRIAQIGYRGFLRDKPLIIPGRWNYLIAALGALIYYRLMALIVRRFHFGGWRLERENLRNFRRQKESL